MSRLFRHKILSTTLSRTNGVYFAKRCLKTLASPNKPSGATSTPNCAFAFDIDGVLLKHRTPVPGASEALQKLQKHHIPFILLTNGGGRHESDRVAELSELLDVEIREDMFLQSHTPFKSLVDQYENVLVVGGEEVGESDKSRHGGVKEVAERYGFKNVHTPNTILHHHPEIWPFDSPRVVLPHRDRETIPSLPKQIDAILVFNDPRHWGPTIQLLLDVLMSSRGELHTQSATPSQPHLWWSNPDLLWQATYSLPRLGQGGFRAALEGVWNAVTEGHRGEIQSRTVGKPHRLTYEYAERVLKGLMKEEGKGEQLKEVFMVGDNPQSDIKGANNYGWESVLVKTGVYREGGKELQGDLKPKMVVEDVGQAVDIVLSKYGI